MHSSVLQLFGEGRGSLLSVHDSGSRQWIFQRTTELDNSDSFVSDKWSQNFTEEKPHRFPQDKQSSYEK